MFAGGLFIAIVGAVLVWAVEISVAGIDLEVAGWILLVAGVTMTVLGLTAARAGRHDYVEDPRTRQPHVR